MELTTEKNQKKCYNSFSCIISVAIIVFVLGAIIYDLTVSKPEIRRNIDEVKIEISELNKKVELQRALTIPANAFNDSIK